MTLGARKVEVIEPTFGASEYEIIASHFQSRRHNALAAYEKDRAAQRARRMQDARTELQELRKLHPNATPKQLQAMRTIEVVNAEDRLHEVALAGMQREATEAAAQAAAAAAAAASGKSPAAAAAASSSSSSADAAADAALAALNTAQLPARLHVYVEGASELVRAATSSAPAKPSAIGSISKVIANATATATASAPPTSASASAAAAAAAPTAAAAAAPAETDEDWEGMTALMKITEEKQELESNDRVSTHPHTHIKHISTPPSIDAIYSLNAGNRSLALH